MSMSMIIRTRTIVFSTIVMRTIVFTIVMRTIVFTIVVAARARNERGSVIIITRRIIVDSTWRW